MRAAVQGENKLQSMPNNTCIMISFAACFAVYLSTIGKGSLAPSVRVLIEESAGVLERIGNITPHRKGTSALYGRHLRVVVGSLLSTPAPRPHSSEILQGSVGFSHPHPQHNTNSPHTPAQHLMYTPQQQQQASIPELLQFSAMSDNQINEAINNAGEEFDLEWAGLQDGSLEGLGMGMGMDRTGLGLDWLNWFNTDVGGGAPGGLGGMGM